MVPSRIKGQCHLTAVWTKGSSQHHRQCGINLVTIIKILLHLPIYKSTAFPWAMLEDQRGLGTDVGGHPRPHGCEAVAWWLQAS